MSRRPLETGQDAKGCTPTSARTDCADPRSGCQRTSSCKPKSLSGPCARSFTKPAPASRPSPDEDASRRPSACKSASSGIAPVPPNPSSPDRRQSVQLRLRRRTAWRMAPRRNSASRPRRGCPPVNPWSSAISSRPIVRLNGRLRSVGGGLGCACGSGTHFRSMRRPLRRSTCTPSHHGALRSTTRRRPCQAGCCQTRRPSRGKLTSRRAASKSPSKAPRGATTVTPGKCDTTCSVSHSSCSSAHKAPSESSPSSSSDSGAQVRRQMKDKGKRSQRQRRESGCTSLTG